MFGILDFVLVLALLFVGALFLGTLITAFLFNPFVAFFLWLLAILIAAVIYAIAVFWGACIPGFIFAIVAIFAFILFLIVLVAAFIWFLSYFGFWCSSKRDKCGCKKPTCQDCCESINFSGLVSLNLPTDNCCKDPCKPKCYPKKCDTKCEKKKCDDKCDRDVCCQKKCDEPCKKDCRGLAEALAAQSQFLVTEQEDGRCVAQYQIYSKADNRWVTITEATCDDDTGDDNNGPVQIN